MKKNSKKKAARAVRKSRGITKIDLSILLTAVLLLLERLPKGVMMRFSDGEQYYIEYMSFFDMIPFGYGDFFPLISAVLTVMLGLVLLGCRLLGKEKLREIAVLTAYLAFFAAVTSLFMGIRFSGITVIRAVIPFLLFAVIQLLHKCRTE